MEVPLVFRDPVKTITDVKIQTLNCSMCDTPLIDVLITHDTNVVWNVVVNCPYCDDKSYVHSIKGDIRYQPTNKTRLFDIDMDKKTSSGEDLLYIKVIRND